MLCQLTLTNHVNESLADGVLAGSGVARHPDHAQASNSLPTNQFTQGSETTSKHSFSKEKEGNAELKFFVGRG